MVNLRSQVAREALAAVGLEAHYLDGATPARARQQEIDAFQRGERPLFLVSLKAGGVGLKPHRRGLRDPPRSLVEPGAMSGALSRAMTWRARR